jgi:hypothetical protein
MVHEQSGFDEGQSDFEGFVCLSVNKGINKTLWTKQINSGYVRANSYQGRILNKSNFSLRKNLSFYFFPFHTLNFRDKKVKKNWYFLPIKWFALCLSVVSQSNLVFTTNKNWLKEWTRIWTNICIKVLQK